MEKTKLSNEEIGDMLFKQVKKPKGLLEVRATNVFENRYRINVWVQLEEDGLTKRKIGASYFAVIDGEGLRVKL